MRTESFRCTAIAVVLLATSAAAAASSDDKTKRTRYAVTPIVVSDDGTCEPGFQRFVYARRLNEAGMAVGYADCFVATGDPAAPYLPRGVRAFRWTKSQGAVELSALSSQPLDVLARDINDQGVAVGYEFPPDVVMRDLIWSPGGGVATVFPASPCAFALTRAEAVNNRGSIAGADYRPNELGFCTSRWLLKLASGEEIAGPEGTPFHMNNNDVLVGDSGQNIVRWSPATGATTLYQGVGGLTASQAWSINDRNEAVGEVIEYDSAGCTTRSDAKLWAADGAESTLPLLRRGVAASAFGINNRGQIVGNVQVALTCDTDVSSYRAVIWSDGEVRNLNKLTPKAFSREYQLTFATGVNDRGQITVRAIRRDEPQVPCPIWDYNFETGEEFYNADRMCRNEYAFLLTPSK